MFSPTTVLLHCNKQPVKVHLVSCGSVAVKTRFRENKYSGFIALADFMLDRKFTNWLPIWVMIIEHPEGIFVIDSGEITEVNEPDYFKSSGIIANWFDKTQFRFSVQKEEEISAWLQKLNIPEEKIKAIVLTHLHFDHTDGIKYFPNTEILVNKGEWEKPFGDLPKLYPAWFRPTLLELTQHYEGFDKAVFLTETKDLVLVETPGHTFHHTSVLLRTDECCVFFAADTCYSQQQLLEEKFPGNNACNKLAKSTYDKVKTFSKTHPVVFIPSHDPEAAQRLQQLERLTFN